MGKYKDIYFDESGWANLPKIAEFLKDKKIKLLCKGERHNWTDGEIHEYYQSEDGEVFEFHGNQWDGKTYIPLLKWVYKKWT